MTPKKPSKETSKVISGSNKKRPKPISKRPTKKLVVRALKTIQGNGTEVYVFIAPGSALVETADISRVSRDDNDLLKGFQRPAIRTHVRKIAEYLSQDGVIFPNAIILALSSDVRFSASRGPKPAGLQDVAQAGTLTIPIRPEGERVAWIVDGQQRSLALFESKNKDIPVPVVGFVSDDLEVQREQFILVNKARPLPSRLINELLPETRGVLLPKELSTRRLPSELCNYLSKDPKSPFFGLIKRISDGGENKKAVVTDTAVVNMIRYSIQNPLGALAPHRGGPGEPSDVEAMYKILITFWTAVRNVFPDAWGLDPRHSRLMHSAGIESMGVLMDRIWARHGGQKEDLKTITQEVSSIAPICRWTKGTWDSLGVQWNEIQNVSRDIKRLQETLVRAYAVRSAR